MPAGLKADPLPVSDSGNASGITHLKMGKKTVQLQLQKERRVTVRKRKNSASTRISEKGGENIEMPEKRFPCST